MSRHCVWIIKPDFIFTYFLPYFVTFLDYYQEYNKDNFAVCDSSPNTLGLKTFHEN